MFAEDVRAYVSFGSKLAAPAALVRVRLRAGSRPDGTRPGTVTGPSVEPLASAAFSERRPTAIAGPVGGGPRPPWPPTVPAELTEPRSPDRNPDGPTDGTAATGEATDGAAAADGHATDGPVATNGAEPGDAEPGDAEPGDAEPSGQNGRGRRHLLPRPLRHVGRLLILALILEYLVVPQIAGTRKAVHLLTQVSPLLLLLGVLLEAAALFAYGHLTRTVLPRDHDPGQLTVLRIQLATMSVSHCVPGGTAAGSSLGYRLMTNAGVPGGDVGFALATQAIGSAVVLNVVLWLALVISIPVWGFNSLYVSAAIVGGILIIGLVMLVFLFTRGERWTRQQVQRWFSRVPFIDEHSLLRVISRFGARIRELGAHPRLLLTAMAWASLNWLLDAASLWVFVGAFGHWANPDGLLVAYGLANVLAAIPLTPGGLGVIEVTLTSTLVGFGTPRGIAVLGVVVYRLVNFWLPIPLGGLTYLTLQVDPGKGSFEERKRRRSARLGSLVPRFLRRRSGDARA
jgi:uncharacterized protein (TIRG00374 family)